MSTRTRSCAFGTLSLLFAGAALFLTFSSPVRADNTGSSLDGGGNIVFSIYPSAGAPGTVTLTTGGGVTASGNVVTNGAVTAAGDVTSGGTVTAGTLKSLGNITGTNLAVTNNVASSNVTVGGQTATSVTVLSANNLANATPCANNQAITKQLDGTFACVNVTDLVNVGTVTMPVCANGSFLTWNGSAFSCVTPASLVANCGAGYAVATINNGVVSCKPVGVTVGGTCTAGSIVTSDASGNLSCTAPSDKGTPMMMQVTSIVTYNPTDGGDTRVKYPSIIDVFEKSKVGAAPGDQNWIDGNCEAPVKSGYTAKGPLGLNFSNCMFVFCSGFFGKYPLMTSISDICDLSADSGDSGCERNYNGLVMLRASCIYLLN